MDNMFPDETEEKLKRHFKIIYGEEKLHDCLKRVGHLLQAYQLQPGKMGKPNLWTHEDHVLITYGDMVKRSESDSESNLKSLHRFIKEELASIISTVHVLPFFPSSSDDGFSVIDYRRVDETLGNWNDITEMSRDFRMMGDLVMNHTSRYSEWFRRFIEREEPYKNFFIEADPKTDLSAVTRPRMSPLLTPVETDDGEKYVWTTFSNDQIDVNFENPDVLFEYLDIFFCYISKGLSVIRLDAVAFIWKEPGTSCIHLKQTHEIVKLMRTLVDCYSPETTIITETNVPHRENISYFGAGDETHMVYQFSLPPLLLHAITTENSFYLREWIRSLKILPDKCTYFNFTASHDGIGVRPLEGLIPKEEFDSLIEGIKKRGGFISEKKNPDGSLSPYEMNITYFDAFKDEKGDEEVQIQRFLCSQILSMSLKGVPGIYFHNLTATRSNHEGVALSGHYRTINRKKWTYSDLQEMLDDGKSAGARVFSKMKEIIQCRKSVAAFDPFGKQLVFDSGKELFFMLRKSRDTRESVLVAANLSNENRAIDSRNLSLPVNLGRSYTDLLTGKATLKDGRGELAPWQVWWLRL
ncbi:MAG: alpha-amylase [Balneolaceae bacterium]|nr:MAG: alpha-amylase [Balneolaceae bacterium]